MELVERIEHVKNKALRCIEEGAKDGNIKVISHHTQIVQEADRLIAAVERIDRDISSLERKVSADPHSQRSRTSSYDTKRGLSRKALGNARRRVFMSQLQTAGIKLTSVKGVVYKTPKRKVAGIAFASEQIDKPGHWFLGLPDRSYDFMVLLCEQDDREMFSLILPKDLLQSYRGKFGKSGKQLKLHVFTDGDRYYIKPPNVDRIDVSRYLNDIDSLAN